jgi:hypothetical protein
LGNRYFEKIKKPKNIDFLSGPKRRGKGLPVQGTAFLIFFSAFFPET